MSSAGWGYTMPDADADRSPSSALGTDPAILREAITMGLSITISLLAVLTAKPHTDRSTAALTLIWGSTVGLALAHWLAFQLTARLFTGGKLSPHDRVSHAAQAAAAIGVAVLASAPLLLTTSSGPALSRLLLAGLIGLIGLIGLFGFGVARHRGASHARSTAYALTVVVIALIVAIGKLLLTGH